MKRRGVVSLCAFGILAAVFFVVAMSPIGRFLFWPEHFVAACERERDIGPLLSIAGTRALPFSVRSRAMDAALNLALVDGPVKPRYLDNETIVKLNADFAEHYGGPGEMFVFAQPFLNGKPNPILAEMVLGQAELYYRLGAFVQLVEGVAMNKNEAEEVRRLWAKVDSEELCDAFRRKALKLERLGLLSDTLRPEHWGRAASTMEHEGED